MKNFSKFNNRQIHNFSIPVINAYFNLFDLYDKQKVTVYDDIIHVKSRIQKIFVFSQDIDSKLVKDLQYQGVIYSIFPLDLEKQSDFEEIVYDIKHVLHPASYKNKKSRYNKLTYPFNYLKKFSVSNIEEIERLHSDWCQKKLDDPKTFKIMFSTKRYFSCCQKALQYPDLYDSLIYKIDGKIVACRILALGDDDTVYDLANFGNFWDYSQLMNYLNMYTIKYLDSIGKSFFNLGASLNSTLKNFKEQYPNFKIKSFKYSKLEPQTSNLFF